MPIARATSTVLIGRAEQMSALEGAFDSVRQGGPAAMLVGGEAGVGKSRLVTEFSACAAQHGARVLAGGCMQLGTDGLPFAPFTSMLRELVHEVGAAGFAAMLSGSGSGRVIRELARLLPELGEPPDHAEPSDARARLFEEVLGLLEQLTARSPVLLIIEDAHWADRSSRDLLTFLIANQRILRGLMVLVTYRSDELHRTHPLRPVLAALERFDWAWRLDLPRLSLGETRDLAASVLGTEVSGELAEELFRRTEGNPLFVESLLCRGGGLNRELPESLRDLLLDSVRRLPEDTQEVLRAASAGAGLTGHVLLAAVTGLDEAALSRALRPAVTANVLRAEAEGYRFRHELIREAVHDDLLPGEHARLHTKFAEAIDADPALVPPGRAAIEMAHHWNSAHDATWALTASWQAAAQAGRAVAPAERLRLLTRVLELWDQVPDAAARIGTDHVSVLAEATEAAHDADEFSRGIAFATSALRELDPAAEPVRAALLLEARARYKRGIGRPGYAEDFWEAVRLVPASVSPAARLRVLLSAEHCEPDSASTKACTLEALELARQTGDQQSQARAMLTLAMHEAGDCEQAAPGSDAIEMIARARELAANAGADQYLVIAAINESHLLEGAGEHALAVEVARQGIVRADEAQLSRTARTLLSINQVEPLIALGRWDEAVNLADEVLHRYLVPLPSHRALLHVLKGQVALARGDVPAAASALSAASDIAEPRLKYSVRLPVASLRVGVAASGGPAAGLMAAGQLLDEHDVAAAVPRYAWPVVSLIAELCADAAGGPLAARAAALGDRLRTIAAKLEVFGPVQQACRLMFAAAGATLGASDGDLSTRAAGDGDLLIAAWDEAAAAWAALSEPYPLGRALLRAARAALRARDPATGDAGGRDVAAVRLQRAARLAADLGATPLGDQVAALARRARLQLGLTAAGTAAAAGTGAATAGLTGRELDVLRLVAAGRSNREIAAELFISPKTASVHVSNILAKLKVTTRTEAAAQAHALGLAG